MAPSSTRQVFSVSPSQPASVLPSKRDFGSARPTAGTHRTPATNSDVNAMARGMVLSPIARDRSDSPAVSIKTTRSNGTAAAGRGGRDVPTLIEKPTRITAAGNKPKLIDEYVGRVNSGE